MSGVNVGYLEFQRKNGRTPVKYPLELGCTTIGTNVSYDIRIKSKSQGPEPVACMVNTKDNGVAILENKCDQPILYNGKKMKKSQMLRNNDEFEIHGKRFRYINPKTIEKLSSVKTFKRQSVTPNLKIKSSSRIPVPSKSTKTRLSLSVTKKKMEVGRRSCASALPDRKRSRINQWETTNSPNVIAGRSSVQKPENLAKLVRKSLFLKNKVFQESLKRTPSPRGVKRALGSGGSSATRMTKKRRYNEKLSFNLSISGTSELFDNSESSSTSKEQDSSAESSPRTPKSHVFDSSLESISPIKTRHSKTPKLQITKKTPASKTRRTPKSDESVNFIEIPDTPLGQDSSLKLRTSSRSVRASANNSVNFTGLKKSPKVGDLLNFGSPFGVFSAGKLRKSTPRVQDLLNFTSPVDLVSPISSSSIIQKTPIVKSSRKTPRSSVKKSIITSRISEEKFVSPVKSTRSTPKVQNSSIVNTSQLSRRTPRSSAKKNFTTFESPIALSLVKSGRSTPKAEKTSSRKSRKTPRSSVKKSIKSDISGVEDVTSAFEELNYDTSVELRRSTPKNRTPRSSAIKSRISGVVATPAAQESSHDSLVELVSPVQSKRSTRKVQKTPTFNTSTSRKTPRKSPIKSGIRGVVEATPAAQELSHDSLVEPVSPVQSKRSTPKVQKTPTFNASTSRKTPISSPRKSPIKSRISGVVKTTPAAQEFSHDSLAELVIPSKSRRSTPKGQKTPTLNISKSGKTPRSSVKKSPIKSRGSGVVAATPASQQLSHDFLVELVSPLKSRRSTLKAQKTPTFNTSRKTPGSSAKKSPIKSRSSGVVEVTPSAQELSHESLVELVSLVMSRRSTPKGQKTPTLNISKSGKTTRKSAKKSPIKSRVSGSVGATPAAQELSYDSLVELVSPVMTRRSTPKGQKTPTLNISKSAKTPRSSVKKSLIKSRSSGVVEATPASQELSHDSLVELVSPVKSRRSTPKTQKTPTFNTITSRKTPGSSAKKSPIKSRSSGVVEITPSAQELSHDSLVELVSPVMSRRSTPKGQKTPTLNISKSGKTPRSSAKKSPIKSRVSGSVETTPAAQELSYDSLVELVSPVMTRRSTPKGQRTPTLNISKSGKTPRSSVKKSLIKSRSSGVVQATHASQELSHDSLVELVSPLKSRRSILKAQKIPTFNTITSRKTPGSSAKKSPIKSRASGSVEATPAAQELSYNSLVELVSPVKSRRSTPKAQKTPTFNTSNSRKTPRSSAKKSPIKSRVSGSVEATPAAQELSYDSLVELVSPVKSRRSTPKAQKTPTFNTSKSRKSPTSSAKKSPIKSRVSGSVEATPAAQELSYDSLVELVSPVKSRRSTPKAHKTPTFNTSNSRKTPRSSAKKSTIKSRISGVDGSLVELISPGKSRKSTPRIPTSLFKTPKVPKSPKNDLSDVRGIKRLLKTPKLQNSPKNDLTDIKGVKQLLKSPKIQKSPKNDLTEVRGVKKLLKTPKMQKSPKNDLMEVRGVKKLLKSPKIQKSPKNDFTDVKGVKKLLKTPKIQKSPKNDLTDVKGVKKLLKTPKIQKSPKNELTDVRGVKRLLRTPKIQKSPKNDLTDVRGVKKLLKTPKIQKSPVNNLLNISGVDRLMKSFELPKTETTPEVTTEKRRRGRPRKNPEEISTPTFESVPQKRGRGSKLQQPITSTPAEEAEVTETRSVRSRAKAEAAPSSEEPNLTSPPGRGRVMRVRKAEKVEEGTPKEEKKTRGRKRKSDVTADAEDVPPVKRSTRGRGKKDESSEKKVEEADEQPAEKKSARGRRKKVEEEVVEEVKPTRSRRKVVEAPEVEEVEEKPTRGKKKIVEDDVIEVKKTRGRKRVVEEEEKDTSSKVTRNTRQKKEVSQVDNTSTKEDNIDESTNNTRSRRCRAVKITNESAPVERRRRR